LNQSKFILRYYIELIAIHPPEKMMNATARIEHPPGGSAINNSQTTTPPRCAPEVLISGVPRNLNY
jgi:hypothetical protein